MESSMYSIKYSATFIKQFNGILEYFIRNLKNKIAAENFYNKVINEIEERSKSPSGYEKYISRRKREYYRIYVNNYTIFYTVSNNTMEIRRILFSRRNFEKLI